MSKKPRFRIFFSKYFKYGFYLTPQNYEAETIHLMNFYGRTDVGRKFTRPSQPETQPQQPEEEEPF